MTWERENVGTWERGVGHGGPTLRAFTLIEMLVSLAVISVALAVVGIVFAITVKTAGQSAAYSETHNWVRQFVQQIDEDLRYCDPSQSILVLVGRTQAAALTPDDLAAGKFYRVLIGNPAIVPAGYDPEYTADPPDAQYSNPRADLLMFFSNRPTVSVAPNPDAATDGDPSNDFYAADVPHLLWIRVVYGHAALGQAQWDGTNYQFPPAANLRHIENAGELSPIPANRWHLSRVATIIQDPNSAPTLQFSSTACGAVSRAEYYQDGPFMPGDAALLNRPLLLQTFGPTYFSASNAPYLSPYDYPSGPLGTWQQANQDSVNTLLYATFDVYPTSPHLHHVATVLEEVPVELKSNLGVHMLPGCVWFQVEFLMPEDPRNSAQYSDPDPTHVSGITYSSRSDMPRWTSINADSTAGPTTYVFVPDTPENRNAVALQADPATGIPAVGSRLETFARLNPLPTAPDTVDNRIIRMWPYAIRITIRVWDARGRLDEPIVRSIVHRFD